MIQTPKMYEDAKLDDIPATLGITNGDLERSMFIYGPVGTGKTHMLWAILNDRKEKGLFCEMVSFESLMRDLRSSFHGKSEKSEAQIIYALSGRAHLSIDDMGGVRDKDAS